MISYYKLLHQLNQEENSLSFKIKLFFESSIYSSTIVSIATIPTVIYYFFSFANYSVLANLLAIPLTAFWVMPLTLVSLLLMPFNLEKFSLLLAGYGVDTIIKIAKIVSTLPYSVTYFGHIDNVSLLIYLFGFLWLVIWQKYLRLLGIVIIIVALIRIAIIPKKPDLILNSELTVFGIKNANDKLEIYSSSSIPEFFLQYWSNWYGQNEILFHDSTIETSNHQIITNSGKIIAIRFKNTKCLPADLVISTIANDKCKNITTKIIDSTILNKSNIVEIYCNKQECRYKIHLKSSRFQI
ncbi:ComEC/Rec2 family competence protein [Candidatus Orientia mediorientalis]|uniref:ComEC/Rec2 family competence protein n=1 Tax=Candidatus Orientia mediorientalis TaxID=911112 RepID=UPI000A7EA675|nr:ComEC/Rec2 family competence protein [Candidatus Orientia mediorientalis]